MTDKEIIIDGVDVSECRHSQTFSVNVKCECEYEEFNGEIETFDECKTLPNCYFKQLKRKEQECEEINLTNERLVVEKRTLNEELLRLTSDQSELRKYIIDVCKLLDIYPKQSLLGTNCLEFYAVLSSTAENKIKDLKNELEFAHAQVKDFNTIAIYYKQALDEIEKILDNATAETQTNNPKWLREYYLARFCEIRDIINKAKENEYGNMQSL